MKAKEILFEMLYLMAGAVDWGLENPTFNLRRATVILNSPNKKLRISSFGILYRRKLSSGGDFAFITSDQNDKSPIKYFMQYKISDKPNFGLCATQVKVWMSIAPGTDGIPAYVFFDIMLKEVTMMISDTIQTVDGKRFWIRRMAKAIELGMQVGMFDGDSQLKYSYSDNFEEWLKSVDGWGISDEYKNKKFYISN